MPTIDPNNPPVMKITDEALKPMKASYVVERYCFEEDKYETQNSYNSLSEALVAYPKLFKEVEDRIADDAITNTFREREEELNLSGLYRIRCEMDVVVATNH